MAVEKHEDFKGSRKREIKDVYNTETDIWIPPIPPEVDVDELWLYRRKRPDHSWLMDNLKIEEGSFTHLKSEYTRRFKNFYEAIKSSLNGNGKNHSRDEEIKEVIGLNAERPSEYNGSFNRIDSQRPNDFPGGIKNIETANRSKSLESLIKFGDKSPGRSLYRRPTNLKIEGEFYHLTEYADEFVEYLLAKRAILCRTPTTLKLGTGEMESKTESMDQFVRYENMERPSLCKRFTNLHLESDLEMGKSENREKFTSFSLPTRPPLVKKSTNLHLQGDYSLIPEYRHQYVQYTNPKRSEPILPSHNLKSARLFEGPPGEPQTFSGRTSPLIPFLRESCNYHGCEEPKYARRSNSSSRYHSTTSLNRASSQPNLTKSAAGEGRKKIRKNAYLEYEGSLERKPTPRKAVPEYKNAYVDFPRERPRVRKPESHFTTEGEVKYVTENREKYRDKPSIIDDLFGKQEDYREPEERFECQPEYRKAYLDYLIREKPPQCQRRRILEIPEININDKTINEAELSSSVEKPAKPELTSKEEKPVPSSPKIAKPKATSPEADASNRRRGSGRRVFPRSSIPSPAPPADNRSTASPRSGGNWRRHQFKETIGETAAGNAWNSLEADPAFFVLGDRAQSRKTAKKDLYKEQRWMPSWHSGEF